jgi:uncharacterized protein YfdQ (DUF2303 family)
MTYGEPTLEATSGDAQAIIDAARRGAEPKPLPVPGGVTTYAIPEGVETVTIDHEQYEPEPRRRRGTAHVRDVASLVEYTKRHQTPGTTLWVHPTDGKIIAVIDDHEAHEIPVDDETARAGSPGHGDHRAHLSLIVTPEWAHWTSRDGTLTEQVAFAEHIEDGLLEIADPSPTTLLEIAQTFHAKTDINFRSANRIATGQVQVQYDEDTVASAGTKAGQLEIPQAFSLVVSPFIGEPGYKLNARLRYRLSGGKLSIGFKLDRPDAVVRDALGKIADRLREEFPGVVFIGTPR